MKENEKVFEAINCIKGIFIVREDRGANTAVNRSKEILRTMTLIKAQIISVDLTSVEVHKGRHHLSLLTEYPK